MGHRWAEHEEIKIFREYLRIPSVHPDIDFEPCIDFVQRQACSLGLPLSIHYPSGDQTKPLIVATWLGSDPQLPSILLTSHMDVVPVYEENWTYPPFGAEIDAEGRIFARGAQDMKCVGTQYLAAVRALKKDGVKQLKRTVHIMFTPDEETGSNFGVARFTRTKEFKDLNVGFTLDEGITSLDDTFTVFYGEKTSWKVQFKIGGNAGHGSLILENTASEKLLYIMNKLSKFRESELKRMENSEGRIELSDVTVVNLTMLEGGVQSNVLPAEIRVVYDIRLAVDVHLDKFEATLKRWATEAGPDIEVVFIEKEYYVEPSNISDSNHFWLAFKAILIDELKHRIKPQICIGSTDSRFLREVGIPAIGFSPIANTPILVHDHDEFLSAEVYLNGIDIYKKLIAGLGRC